MIALLLNSGLGTRMGDETQEHPKCMTKISDRETIISWQPKCLECIGVTDAVVTTGHLSDLLADQEVLSRHRGLVMHPEAMARRAGSPVSAVTVDSTLPLPEKDFKGRIRDGQPMEVGVNVYGEDCVELQPAYRFLAADFDRWMQEIRRFIAEGTEKVYAENAFNAVWEEIPVYPLDLAGLLCAEIDNQADKEYVSARFAKEVLA